MYFVFLALWIIFNGRVTAEVVLIGMVLCAALYAFCCAFLGYSVRQDVAALKRAPLAVKYSLTLIVEILKANRQVLHFIMSPKYEVEPRLIHFHCPVKTELAKVVLANSITLTPGTITVGMEGDEFYVHCLDRDFAEGIETSVFVELLKKMEEIE